MDHRKNFAQATIAVAPNTPEEGLTLTLLTGGGAVMPTPPFNAVMWPRGQQPALANAEIARVQTIAGEEVTFSARGQEGTVPQTVRAGWQFAAAITAKALDDIQVALEAETTRAEAAEAGMVSAAALAAETTRAQAAEALLAPKASPALTGNPTAPTQPEGDNSTKLATTAFVHEIGAAVAVAAGAEDAAERARAEAAEATKLPAATKGAAGGVPESEPALKIEGNPNAGLPLLGQGGGKAKFEEGAAWVTTAMLAALAVTTAKLAAGCVTAAKLAAEAVETVAIKAEAVTGPKIAAGAIVAAKIAANAVETAAIKARAVTSEKLAESISLEGIPKAPTAAPGTNTTQIATTAYAHNAAAEAQSAAEAIQPSGDVTGATDTAAIQAKLNAGGIVTLAAGLFWLNATLTMLAKTTLLGAGTFNTLLKAVPGTVLNGGLVVSAAWATNSANSGEPIMIRNLGVYPNGCAGHGIILMNYNSDVDSVYVSAPTAAGIVLADKNSAGASIANTEVECRIRNCKIYTPGTHGIWVKDEANAGKITDGYCQSNIVAFSGDVAIRIDRAAGWFVDNHVYACGNGAAPGALATIAGAGGFYLGNCWDTFCVNNEVDGFGAVSNGGKHIAFNFDLIAGRPSVISGNNASANEAAHAESEYIYFRYHNASAVATKLRLEGNVAHADTTGGKSSTGGSYRANGGSITLTVTGNMIDGPSATPSTEGTVTFLGDGSQWGQPQVLEPITVNATEEVPIPPTAKNLRITVAGGGGGGGGAGSAAAEQLQVGGGGGAAGSPVTRTIPVGASTVVKCVIGAGGNGGNAGAAGGHEGSNGTAGTGSTAQVGATIIHGPGGQFGLKSIASAVAAVAGGLFGTTNTAGSTSGATNGAGGASGNVGGPAGGFGESAGGGGGGVAATAAEGGNGGGAGTAEEGGAAAGHTGTTEGGEGASAAANTGGGGGGGGGGAKGTGAGGKGGKGGSGYVLIEPIA